MATHHTHHKRPTITANCKKARDVVIAVRLDRKAAAAIDGVTRWVTGTLGKLYPVPEEVPNSSSSYPCAVVSGTHHDDWADGETEEVYNRILLVCHRSWGAPCNHIVVNSDQSCDGMTVVAEHDNEVGDQFLLCPELIRSELEVQQNAPAGVTAVGVSGVSERYAAAVWRQIISTTRDWMDGEGSGYMIHPQWMWSEAFGTHTVREMSYNFGWHGHAEICETMDRQEAAKRISNGAMVRDRQLAPRHTDD
jgi:hypothetical protein